MKTKQLWRSIRTTVCGFTVVTSAVSLLAAACGNDKAEDSYTAQQAPAGQWKLTYDATGATEYVGTTSELGGSFEMNWGTNAPASGGSADFCATFTTTITAPHRGFIIYNVGQVDDSVAILVDGKHQGGAAIDPETGYASQEGQTIYVEAGSHRIDAKYCDFAADAFVSLDLTFDGCYKPVTVKACSGPNFANNGNYATLSTYSGLGVGYEKTIGSIHSNGYIEFNNVPVDVCNSVINAKKEILGQEIYVYQEGAGGNFASIRAKFSKADKDNSTLCEDRPELCTYAVPKSWQCPTNPTEPSVYSTDPEYDWDRTDCSCQPGTNLNNWCQIAPNANCEAVWGAGFVQEWHAICGTNGKSPNGDDIWFNPDWMGGYNKYLGMCQ